MAEQKRQRRRPQPVPRRPRMPASYGVDAAWTAGTLAWSAVRHRLASERNYWLATTRPDGRPHAMPVWGVWLDEALYFSTDQASRKGRNLSANPSVVIHLESGDDVVVLEGKAEQVTEPSLLGLFTDAYQAKYQFRPDVNSPASRVYRLRPQVAFAWHEKDFPTSATKWTFG